MSYRLEKEFHVCIHSEHQTKDPSYISSKIRKISTYPKKILCERKEHVLPVLVLIFIGTVCNISQSETGFILLTAFEIDNTPDSGEYSVSQRCLGFSFDVCQQQRPNPKMGLVLVLTKSNSLVSLIQTYCVSSER